MGLVASSPLEPAWKDLLDLSTRRAPEFYEKSDEIGNVPHAGALRTTFVSLGASAVFCVQYVPTIVIFSVDEYDPGTVASLHAALWNQGLASLLVVISGDTVRVFTLARMPRFSDEYDVATRYLVQALNAATDALALGNLIYSAESGRFWEEHPDHFNPKERVDRVLLDNLTQSHRMLCEAGLSADEAQALLVQAMFVAYLEDREIIGNQYFLDASNEVANNFVNLLRSNDVQSLERLFKDLRKVFNGDLFFAPCSFEANGPGPHLHSTHLEILARFRSGFEELHGEIGQYRFWPYNFKYIPVELISAVHDRFLGERGAAARRAKGAYYTPMFLADIVISNVWDKLSSATRESGCFLDPACGSGIFLVRLFQRLCEHRRETRPEHKIPWDDLLDFLSRLQGRDLDGGAVRVAVFSLYVALLEEVNPPDIRELMKHGKVLPLLYGKTLRHEDFFAVEPDDVSVEVVVGNPPWSSRRGGDHTSLVWCRDEGLPAPVREQSWPFVWKALRHLRENGVVAFLLPAMGFLHNHAGSAVAARKRLIREARVYTVINFADMRFQLFDGAVRPAALLLLGRSPAGGAPYRFDYLTPKADLNLKARRLITIGGGDRCRLDSRMVEADPSVFKKRLWLTEPEARLFNYLSQFPCLSKLVFEFGKLSKQGEPMQNRWVVGHGFKPATIKQLQNDAYEREHSSVVATTPYLPIEKFRVLTVTDEGLHPWKDSLVHRRGFEEGFKGPRVLVPRGIAIRGGNKKQRLRAAYIEAPLTFQDIIQTIVVPPENKRCAMLLVGLLNSRLMLWFAFHGTSSFGSDRPILHQAELLRLPFPAPNDTPDPVRSRSAADALIAVIEKQVRPTGQTFGGQPSEHEMLEEIDDLAYEFFCLSDEEKILVEDTVEHTIPSVQPSRKGFPEVWQPSTQHDRCSYARTLVDSLTDWFDSDCAIGTRLVARNDDLAILRLSLRDAPGAFDYAEDDDASVAAVLAHLAEHIHQPLPGNLQLMPDLRVFIDSNLFLVKPARKRFWLRSTALADANAIAIDLHAIAGPRHDVLPGQG